MKGIWVSEKIGIGDAVQFTSVPENYFRQFGEKLADHNRHWVFDHNPYVDRVSEKVDESINLWDLHCLNSPKEVNGRTFFQSNAHAHARHFKYQIRLNRPRLYAHEHFPFYQRNEILLHVKGRSHGQLPLQVVEHVLEKYGIERITLIGSAADWIYDLPMPARRETKNIWDLVALIARARMLIGPDSGPSWIAQCYPDVLVKKVRLLPSVEALHDWMPLEWCRLGSHWDDRSAMVYNPSDDDAGFTWSYRKI